MEPESEQRSRWQPLLPALPASDGAGSPNWDGDGASGPQQSDYTLGASFGRGHFGEVRVLATGAVLRRMRVGSALTERLVPRALDGQSFFCELCALWRVAGVEGHAARRGIRRRG